MSVRLRLAITTVKIPSITERLCPAALTITLPSIQPLATTLLDDIIQLRHFQHLHSSLYVLRFGVTGFFFGFLKPEDGTDRLSRNVGKKLPLLAA